MDNDASAPGPLCCSCKFVDDLAVLEDLKNQDALEEAAFDTARTTVMSRYEDWAPAAARFIAGNASAVSVYPCYFHASSQATQAQVGVTLPPRPAVATSYKGRSPTAPIRSPVVAYGMAIGLMRECSSDPPKA